MRVKDTQTEIILFCSALLFPRCFAVRARSGAGGERGQARRGATPAGRPRTS